MRPLGAPGIRMASHRRDIVLVYDGHCPVCDAYSRMLRIRDSVGTLRLCDARQSPEARERMEREGLDLDEGLVLDVDGVLYHGADAMHVLAMISGSVGAFNRLNHWVFRSRSRSKALYPLLKAGRSALLRMLGTEPFNVPRVRRDPKP